jgi:hypothetical protein
LYASSKLARVKRLCPATLVFLHSSVCHSINNARWLTEKLNPSALGLELGE